MAALFGLGSTNKATGVTRATALRIQTSIVGKPIPIVYGQVRIAGNLIDYVDFASIPVSTSAGGKGSLGAGGGKGSSGGSYNYSAAVDIALCQGPIASVIQVWNNKTQQALADLNLTAFLGGYSQTAWSYMSSRYPSRALNYRGIAHCAAGPMQLGNTAELANLSFEVLSAIANGISGLPDADPADVTDDLLTNDHYGVGFPAAMLGALTDYSSYARATGMVVSLALTELRPASDILRDLTEATNSAFRWSNGVLDIVPYGDTAITAHGATYTPPAAPQYSLGKNDFLPRQGGNGSSGPVQGSRVMPVKGRFNQIKLQFLDRATGYNQNTATASNELNVDLVGPRPQDPKTYDFFCDANAAQQSAQLILGRQEIANQYYFTLGRRFIRLDPMDIVAITDSVLQISEQWVRIIEITENDDGSLNFLTEEYLQGTGAAPIYGNQASSGYVPDYNSDPGNTTSSAIFDVPVQLAQLIGLESWLAVTGGTNWGGCQVWVSSDNATYQQVGKILGPSRMGTLSATFASGSDPDTVNTLAVDMSASHQTLLSGTLADANAGNTLCYVDGEYVSYQQATLTSADHYNLGKSGATPGLLRRGQYGSAISSHASGSLFVRLDDSVFALPYTPDRLGQMIYIKLPAFNIWGGGQQDLASVSAVTHVIGGPPTVYNASSLAVVGALRSMKLAWINAPNFGQSAIEIWRSASSSFGSAAVVGRAAANSTTYIDQNSIAPNTAYWYWIRPIDMAGNPGAYSPSSGGAGATATSLQAVTSDVAPDAITTPKILTGAANVGQAITGSDGSTTNSASSYTTFASCTVTGLGGPVVLICTFNYSNLDSGAYTNANAQITKDNGFGVPVAVAGYPVNFNTQAISGGTLGFFEKTFTFQETLALGVSATYRIQISGDASVKHIQVTTPTITPIVMR